MASEAESKIAKIRSELDALKEMKKKLEEKEKQFFKTEKETQKSDRENLSKSKQPKKPRKTKQTSSKTTSEFDPEQLILTKNDIVGFCDRILEKWNNDPSKDLKQIFAMNAVRASVLWTDDESIKAIWKEIVLWMYELLYENAVAQGNEENSNWSKTLSKIQK